MGLADFKTRSRKYSPGYGLVLELTDELPRHYDDKTFGAADGKGLSLTGTVVDVFSNEHSTGFVPAIKSKVTVTVRPDDARRTIYDDLSKTTEGHRFLFEGVSGESDALVARWAHGAGGNRLVEYVEIVGVPHVVFENPVKTDGPKSGFLRLNLDGSPTTFDERLPDGTYVEREFDYAEMVSRLEMTLRTNGRFRVGQRALFPSLAVLVDGQEALEAALTKFRGEGMTHCVVRTFVPGTTDARNVDVQLLSWPLDIPANGNHAAKSYEMPVLVETKRFAALRDGTDEAHMEVIPGFVMNLVGNPSDPTKSNKHKFVNDIVKGHSDKQKSLFASQSYGPGISIHAVNESGETLGMTRLAIRVDGPQYRNLLSIPTEYFDASIIKFTSDAQQPAESGAEEPPAE
jgi:hypothetical protein